MIDKLWFKSIASAIFILLFLSFIYQESVSSMSVELLLLISLPAFIVIFVVITSFIFDSKMYGQWVDERITGNKAHKIVFRFFTKKIIEAAQVVSVFSPLFVYFEFGYLEFLRGNSDVNMELKALRVVVGFALIAAMYLYLVRPFMIKIFKVNG